MMNKKLAIFLALSVPFSAHAVVLLADENYDGTNGSANNLVATQNVTIVNGMGPAGSSGNVGLVDLSTGGRWGEARGSSVQDIPLPGATVAGTDTYTMTIDYYFPSLSTNMVNPDALTLILRWNIGNTGNHGLRTNTVDLVQDAWTTITHTGTIPALGSDGLATTVMTPIVSFEDRDDDAGVGLSMYIDNFELSVTTSVPEPSGVMITLLGAGLLGFRRKR